MEYSKIFTLYQRIMPLFTKYSLSRLPLHLYLHISINSSKCHFRASKNSQLLSRSAASAGMSLLNYLPPVYPQHEPDTRFQRTIFSAFPYDD